MSQKLNVSLSADLSLFKKLLIPLGGGQAAKAVTDSLNNVAFDSQRALQALTLTAFSDPVPFTQRAFGVEQAKVTQGVDAVARVFVRDVQAKFLEPQILGGVRKAGDYATTKGGPLVPGGSIQLNAAGNFPTGPRRYLARKLAGGSRDKRGFIRPLGGGVGGVFGRLDSGDTRSIQLLAVIKPRVVYRKRFKFVETIEGIFDKNFEMYFDKNFSKLKFN